MDIADVQLPLRPVAAVAIGVDSHSLKSGLEGEPMLRPKVVGGVCLTPCFLGAAAEPVNEDEVRRGLLNGRVEKVQAQGADGVIGGIARKGGGSGGETRASCGSTGWLG